MVGNENSRPVKAITAPTNGLEVKCCTKYRPVRSFAEGGGSGEKGLGSGCEVLRRLFAFRGHGVEDVSLIGWYDSVETIGRFVPHNLVGGDQLTATIGESVQVPDGGFTPVYCDSSLQRRDNFAVTSLCCLEEYIRIFDGYAEKWIGMGIEVSDGLGDCLLQLGADSADGNPGCVRNFGLENVAKATGFTMIL